MPKKFDSIYNVIRCVYPEKTLTNWSYRNVLGRIVCGLIDLGNVTENFTKETTVSNVRIILGRNF